VLSDLKGGMPGFSGSHDATIALVQSGSYDAGVVNQEVWNTRVKEGKVNSEKLKEIWKTPAYQNYHWLVQPNLDARFGKGFTNKIKKALLGMNRKSSQQKIILDLFGANKFISAKDSDYKIIEEIGRLMGKIK